MQTLAITLKIDFDPSLTERQATDLLELVAEQIAKHTVAKRIVAAVLEGDKKLGHAAWNDSQNKLMVCTDSELQEVAGNYAAL